MRSFPNKRSGGSGCHKCARGCHAPSRLSLPPHDAALHARPAPHLRFGERHQYGCDKEIPSKALLKSCYRAIAIFRSRPTVPVLLPHHFLSKGLGSATNTKGAELRATTYADTLPTVWWSSGRGDLVGVMSSLHLEPKIQTKNEDKRSRGTTTSATFPPFHICLPFCPAPPPLGLLSPPRPHPRLTSAQGVDPTRQKDDAQDGDRHGDHGRRFGQGLSLLLRLTSAIGAIIHATSPLNELSPKVSYGIHALTLAVNATSRHTMSPI